MKKLLFLFSFIILFSCQDKSKMNVKSLRLGYYKTVLEYKNITSYALRNDSIQIETYENKNDTFYINWVSNFEYVLLKKNPQSLLDSTPFHVKITGIKNNSYTFDAYHKGSNFKQKGTATKIE